MMIKPVNVRAPGKIILSGEHAVTQGCPALALAVSHFTKASISLDQAFQFHWQNLNVTSTYSLSQLQAFQGEKEKDYEKFKTGQLPIFSVLKNQEELAEYTVSSIVTQLKAIQGLNIQLSSDLPLGCGMGSSAALIAVLYAGIHHLHDKNWHFSEPDLQNMKSIESLQHGFSSGLDLQVSVLGGCHYFQQGKSVKVDFPNFPLYYVNTGMREASSSSNIMDVQKRLAGQLTSFSKVTEAMLQAIKDQHHQHFCTAMDENHQLLIDLGVVPQKVVNFIEVLQSKGFSAKISGAGATCGSRAGLVLITGQGDPFEICRDQGYVCEKVIPDFSGVNYV